LHKVRVLFGIGFVHSIIENDDWMRSHGHIAGRVLIVALTFWALAMVVPDFYRLYRPPGSFGFYSNNDGIITDVQGPFPDQTASPAFRAGLRAGDRLDLEQMRFPYAHSDARVRWRPWEAFGLSLISSTPSL
jgi:hypothetical protein